MTSLASLSSRFPFEPNAAFGREYVDVGGNIIMTEDGCEVLNVMPTAMRLVREIEVERGSCVLSGYLSSLVRASATLSTDE